VPTGWLLWGFLALAAACGAARGGAIEVVQERWGFNGHVVPHHINLLSLEIANRAAVPL